MLELIGGPFDGRTYNRNPDGNEVLVGPQGQIRNPGPDLGENTRYVEDGVCQGCGVRVESKTASASSKNLKVRRFVLEEMAKGQCDLCGKKVA